MTTSKIKSEYATPMENGSTIVQTSIQYANGDEVFVVSVIKLNDPKASSAIYDYTSHHKLHAATHMPHSHWVYTALACNSINGLRKALP